MDYPSGPSLIFEDEFFKRSEMDFRNLKWAKLLSFYINGVMGSSYYTPVQISLIKFHLVWWRSSKIYCREELATLSRRFFGSSRCIPFLDFPSLLAHRIVYSLANLLNPAHGSSTKWPAYNYCVRKACQTSDQPHCFNICRSFCARSVSRIQ